MKIATKYAFLAFLALLLTKGTSAAQLRYENSLSLSGGAYAASGFGTNQYFGLRYNYFFYGGRYFVEGSFGLSSLKSDVLESVAKAQLFESERLYSYEFVFAIDAYPSGYIPFFVLGVAGVNQGGQTKFAGVLGLGKRIPLYGFLGTDKLGWRYDIRDQIFSQEINSNDSFVTHNLVFSLGLQFYF